ncbi:MAG: ABC transporter ATP-binding protein [Actinobacteria bacterium]|nr:ABC transporter ATP-binding protein [Actinomycetota bacterium]
MTKVLSVKNLSISVPSSQGRATVVDDLSFAIEAGKKVGLVGESGSGKSLTALALMRLIKSPVQIDAGQIFLGDRNVLSMDMQDFRHIRGNEISMIYQDPMSALNPIMRVGQQIVESIQLQSNATGRQARAIAVDHLASVGIPEPERRFDSYPFEMSGGMLQRVVIAIALSGEPKVLIADEATTALDVTTQDRVLTLIDKLAAERGLSVLLITHDLGVAAQFSDDILVMYAGKLVECGSVNQIFSQPVHPYTKALLDSRCDYTIDITKPIKSIAGQPPRPDNRPSGCVFSPRCEHAQPQCSASVPPLEFIQDRYTACFRAEDLFHIGQVN